jgi:hypothetical protein
MIHQIFSLLLYRIAYFSLRIYIIFFIKNKEIDFKGILALIIHQILVYHEIEYSIFFINKEIDVKGIGLMIYRNFSLSLFFSRNI